eukprot:5094571-Pyramimonas_sp.AAC.1
MASLAPGAVEAQGIHRIPPAWQPGTDYTFRDWERDITNWTRLTDLQADQIGGAIYPRVSGLAKTLLREIPGNVISYGADGRPGVEILMAALRARWGGEGQDKQLQLLAAFDEFDVGPREDYEDAIA